MPIGNRYTEFISPLYARTHFHFSGLADILDFRQHVLPNRFVSIRILSIDWEPNPFFPTSTPQMRVDDWSTISQMKGLQQLRAYMETICVLPDSSTACSLKQNRRKVKGLQSFELTVTKDQFAIWGGILEANMEVELVVNTKARVITNSRQPRQAWYEHIRILREKRTYSQSYRQFFEPRFKISNRLCSS
jgi:hypothetical protein